MVKNSGKEGGEGGAVLVVKNSGKEGGELYWW